MSGDDPAVKVLCGTCQRLLCRVIATPQGLAYEITAGRGGSASSPAGVWCPGQHGWPDLASPALAAGLARAQRSGKVGTYRADMMPRPPLPL